MKHFVVEGTHLASPEQILEKTPAHRAFLEKGYRAGLFLCSGPQTHGHGGFLVARAASKDALEQMLADEPFKLQGMIRYDITEFQPTLRQSWAEDWFTGKA